MRAVVVTGCSSGIGRATALHLARSKDFLVFATTRKAADAKELESRGRGNLVPVPNLDLTLRRKIKAAVDSIKSRLRYEGLTGLYAIVNNAGGGAIAPLELLDMDLMENELRTRVVGAATLVQMLLPEIRTGKGRLLWITTPGPMPLAYKSSIHVPEFAVHGLARTFRIELSPWNIPSIMIACGGIRSNATSRMDEQLSESLKSWSKGQLALYGSALGAVLKRDRDIRERAVEAQKVANAVERALRDSEPKPIYRVGLSKTLSSMTSLPETQIDDFFISMIKSDG